MFQYIFNICGSGIGVYERDADFIIKMYFTLRNFKPFIIKVFLLEM